MEEQTYKIKNVKSFEPVHIFDCGQCFRWDKELDGSYTGVFKGNVMNVKKDGNTFIPHSCFPPVRYCHQPNCRELCHRTAWRSTESGSYAGRAPSGRSPDFLPRFSVLPAP